MKYFECEALRAVTGETVRPGGYNITRKAVSYCRLKPDGKLLDVGCGTGATVELLIKEFHLAAVGIDPSAKMLELGTGRCPELPIGLGQAESLGFTDQSMDAVLSECSLSHYTDISRSLREFQRVLAAEGCLIISDIYIRTDKQPEREPGNAANRGFMDQESILRLIEAHGFETELWEDHTYDLKQLSIALILKYGSLEKFWQADCRSCTDCDLADVFNKDAKLGYYLLIARKKTLLNSGEDIN